MNASVEAVHVVFGLSTAATLRKALPLLGSAERVIGLINCLSVGPIDPPDPVVRHAWGKSVLGAAFLLPGQLDGDPVDMERAWTEAAAPSVHPVFWVCRRSPMEHACFLAFAARMKDRSVDIVDATNLDFTTADGVRSPSTLGMMRVKDIVASGLYATRRPITAEERDAASLAWSELRRENAPFRVVRNGRLVSAPLTHYDALLIGAASQEWEIAVRLIGRVMSTFFDASMGDGTGDAVLFGRMLALAEAGALEIAGPGPDMRDYQVRKPVG